MTVKTKLVLILAGSLALCACSTVQWNSGSQNATEARTQCANQAVSDHATQGNAHQFMEKCMESRGYRNP